MRVDQAVRDLLKLAQAHDISWIAGNTRFFGALVDALGAREAREVTARELHEFYRALPVETRTALEVGRSKVGLWESMYERRFVSNDLPALPWEAPAADPFLVEMIDRGVVRPGRVLELGCGDGTNAVHMAKMGFQVTAVDISATAVEIARKNAEAAGVDCTFIATDLWELRIEDRHDVVFDRGCFHHVPVFFIESYKEIVDAALREDGCYVLRCHGQRARPKNLIDALNLGLAPHIGHLYRVLAYVISHGMHDVPFLESELDEIFSDRFAIGELRHDVHEDSLHDSIACVMKRI